jgi:hypothetical protein
MQDCLPSIQLNNWNSKQLNSKIALLLKKLNSPLKGETKQLTAIIKFKHSKKKKILIQKN